MLCWGTWGRLKREGCEQVAARVCRVRTACPGVSLVQRDGKEYVAGGSAGPGWVGGWRLGEVHLFVWALLSLATERVS